MAPEEEAAELLACADPEAALARRLTGEPLAWITGRTVFCGVELVWSRFANVDDVPFVSRVADSFSNGTYTIGSGVTSFAGLDLATLPCRLTIAGSVANDRRGGHANGDPMTPLVAWANVQADHLGGMRAGQFLTLGTLNTPVPVSGAAEIEATLEGIGAARVSLR